MSVEIRQAQGSEEAKQHVIPFELLEQYGASSVRLQQDELLFQQGEPALFFHVVHSGRVKMAVYTEKGREFVQGYFTEGETFGEPPFFRNEQYPASCVAVTESRILRIARREFLQLLEENPAAHLALTRTLCDRLLYKAMMLSELAVEEAEHRLRTIIKYFHEAQGNTGEEFLVPFTRQQLADMTGLRVETVIRTVKEMEQEGLLKIVRGKIIWAPGNTSG